jgi:hypothetical protein
MVGISMNVVTESSEKPSAGHQEPGVEWRLLAELGTTTDAMVGVGYVMRILSHMLAVGDHRHLAAYARDLDNAVTALEPVNLRLTEVVTEAAVAWGMSPSGWGMTELVAKAPAEVSLPLAQAVEELSLISRELETDGAVAEELAGGAIGLVSKRRSELESGGPPLTYAPAEIAGASRGKITGSALRAGALTS